MPASLLSRRAWCAVASWRMYRRGSPERPFAASSRCVLAFGVAALLYLVTEELLVEANEVTDTPIHTAVFFVGFIAFFLVDILL